MGRCPTKMKTPSAFKSRSSTFWRIFTRLPHWNRRWRRLPPRDQKFQFFVFTSFIHQNLFGHETHCDDGREQSFYRRLKKSIAKKRYYRRQSQQRSYRETAVRHKFLIGYSDRRNLLLQALPKGGTGATGNDYSTTAITISPQCTSFSFPCLTRQLRWK